MAETTPNAKGPAKVQLSPEQMANLGLTSTPEATAPEEPTLIPADQVKPEDISTLSIEYRNGQPVIVVRGGQYIPTRLPVVDESEFSIIHDEIHAYIGGQMGDPAVAGFDPIFFLHHANVDR
ncbi:tyrosinase family protein [Kitasatospora sp. NPDC001574]